MVQQELSLAPHLSIAENIGLGAYARRGGLVDYGRLASAIAEIGKELGLIEPPDTPVGQLPLGRRQIVEIAKALFIKPRVLILDEPTSSLAAPDVAILMRLVRRLRDQGVAILYISHRLNEILDFCDYVTVLKDGSVTADRPLAGLDPTGLVRLMVGRDPQNLFPPYASHSTGELVLETKGFRAGGRARRRFRASSRRNPRDRRPRRPRPGRFHDGPLRRRSRPGRTLPRIHERAAVRSAPFAKVADANAVGVAYVPADRRKEGLLLPHSIDFNLLLPLFASRSAERRRGAQETAITERLAQRLNIRGDRRRPAQALSGGNQQKVALSKWLPLEPSVLL